MTNRVIAKNLTVTCSDGSCHENVTLTVCHNKRIYTAPDGCKLCVKKINGGTFLVSASLATMIFCGCPLEVD
jgi:hypothetical protein